MHHVPQPSCFRRLAKPCLAAALPVLAVTLPAQAGRAPKVVSLQPPHLAVEVDAKQTEQLVVKFDVPMSRRRFSFCGGGPTMPKASRSRWKDKFTCVMDVTLEPGRDYSMSLNCPAAMGFRSAEGVALAPTPWRSTAPSPSACPAC